MSQLTVNFRGLFAVVRHIDPPAVGQTVTSVEEPMSLVFAVDDGAGSGHAHGDHQHNAALRIHENAFRDGPDTLSRIGLPFSPALAAGFMTLDIKGKTVWLPANGRYDAVSHKADEEVGELGFAVDCAKVGVDPLDPERWRPLTRLGNLNALTGGTLDVNVAAPDPARVQSVVRLSGGTIGCLRSYKALADCFFEFYDADSTVTVQPGVEDVQYTVESDDNGFVQIGFGNLGDAAPAIVVPIRADMPLIIDSLPPPGSPLAPDLNHFGNFYKLMRATAGSPGIRTPLIRVAARCENNQIVHTMAGHDGIHRHFLSQFAGLDLLSTPGVCTCLVAQTFRPL